MDPQRENLIPMGMEIPMGIPILTATLPSTVFPNSYYTSIDRVGVSTFLFYDSLSKMKGSSRDGNSKRQFILLTAIPATILILPPAVLEDKFFLNKNITLMTL